LYHHTQLSGLAAGIDVSPQYEPVLQRLAQPVFGQIDADGLVASLEIERL